MALGREKKVKDVNWSCHCRCQWWRWSDLPHTHTHKETEKGTHALSEHLTYSLIANADNLSVSKWSSSSIIDWSAFPIEHSLPFAFLLKAYALIGQIYPLTVPRFLPAAALFICLYLSVWLQSSRETSLVIKSQWLQNSDCPVMTAGSANANDRKSVLHFTEREPEKFCCPPNWIGSWSCDQWSCLTHTVHR